MGDRAPYSLCSLREKSQIYFGKHDRDHLANELANAKSHGRPAINIRCYMAEFDKVNSSKSTDAKPRARSEVNDARKMVQPGDTSPWMGGGRLEPLYVSHSVIPAQTPRTSDTACLLIGQHTSNLVTMCDETREGVRLELQET
ncbi:hypothetical protein AcV5_008386 [Taiwanofungus camphoratus]|nr:hypothetical protein AcV5_008386 [Antrodia cinnamomea]